MNIQKLLIFIFLLSTFAQANEGPVSANAVVSNKNILSGNVVSLHIRATGQQAVFPMVKNIDGVKILSSDERITNMHVYNNGKLKKECTILTLTFAPQKDMTIPSYEVEIEGRIYKTKPIKLKMKDTTTSNQNKSDIFSLKLKSNQKRVNVGEAFLVTVRLSLQDNFIISKKLQYHRPKFEGFFVEQIGKGKSYDDKNGHLVTEIKYILTPHSEGSYILGPAYAKIGLQDRSKKRMVNVDKSRKMFQRASNTLELEVLSKMTQSDLVGAFALESNIDTQKVAAGKPVKLRIKIKGTGDLTRFDFPDYTLEGVTVYSDEAKVNIREVDAKIYSSYSKEFVFISEEDFSIPEQTFTMYDPKDGTLKELKISSIDIRVDQSDAITVKTKISKSFTPNTSIKNEAMKLKEKLEDIPSYWWILLLSFIVGGLFFYLLRYLPKQKQRSYKESEALKILLPHISEDPGVEEMVLKLYARKNGDRSVKINKKKLKMLLARFS
jgi:hypothetical protein